VAIAAVNEGPVSRGRWLLGLGLAGFGLTMFVWVLELAVAQSRLASWIFRLDGETGYLFDRVPPDQSYDAFWQTFEPEYLSMTLTAVALLSLIFVLFGLRRADRGLALVRSARPIAAPGWSAAALGCFGLGLLAMIATRPYVHDRAMTLAVCETAEYVNWGFGPQRVWPRHPGNPTSTELRAVRPRECASGLWIGFGFQLFEDGTLTEIPFSRRWKTVDEWLDSGESPTGLDPEQLRAALTYPRELAEGREEPIAIALYADGRTPVVVSREHLEVIRDAGVDEILLLGQATITGELATVGSWRYRVFCPLGRVRFGEATHQLDEFEAWADLAAAAAGPEPLRLALD
jgi:hypothetical protein